MVHHPENQTERPTEMSRARHDAYRKPGTVVAVDSELELVVSGEADIKKSPKRLTTQRRSPGKERSLFRSNYRILFRTHLHHFHAPLRYPRRERRC